MRDLAFDIRAHDRTQSAFDSAERRAGRLGSHMEMTSREIARSTGAMNRMTAATDRYAAAARRAGAANDNWQRRNLQMQMMDVGQMLALGQNPMTTLLQQGPQIAQIYGPGEGGVTRVFKEMGSMVLGAVTKFPLLTAAAVATGVGFAGLTYEINQTTDVAVGFGDVMLGTLQAVGQVIYNVLEPAIGAIAPWFASAWDMVVQGTKAAGNAFVGAWIVQIDALKTGIGAVPDAFLAAGEAAANGFLAAIEQMIREALVGINGMLTDINGMLRSTGFEIPLAPAPMSVRLGRVDLGGAAAGQRLGGTLQDFMGRARETMSRDYMGEFFGMVRGNAIAKALAGEKDKKKGGKSEAEKLAERYRDIVTGAQQATEAFRLQEEALFMTEEAAAALKYQQDLLNKAQNAGIQLTAQQRGELTGLGSAMAAAEEAYKRTKDALDFAKSTVKGFVADLRSGLEQGKGFWESFGQAALNVLDKITDRLLNQVIDALFQVNSASMNIGGGGTFGGGGLLSSIFGGLGRLFGFRAEGGAADPWGSYLVGEKGPEVLRMGSRGGQVLSNAQVFGRERAAAPPQELVIRGVFVDDNGVIKAQVTSMGQQAAQAGTAGAVDQVKRNLQGWSGQISRDGAL